MSNFAGLRINWIDVLHERRLPMSNDSGRVIRRNVDGTVRAGGISGSCLAPLAESAA
jgi:hypothetical protein